MRGKWGAGVLVAVLAGGGLAACGAGSATAKSPTVRTDKGTVRGVRAGTVDSFLGVPYAAAPVAELRWRPPQPAPSWSGVRPADRYGSRCPALASNNGPKSVTEDCLFLNVQRPAGSRPGDGLPVFFWIHGGGDNGSSNQYDGSQIVAEGKVIVVTINYRLGVFGFLAHPALTRESGESGNYGFLDQQAALGWVAKNISAFGGDPRRVTIGGESAGGNAVCAHLAAPGSRGLFSGAIIQSGSCEGGWTQPLAEATGTAVANAVACTDPAAALACLRGTATGRLLDASAGQPFTLVGGTPTLPLDAGAAIRQGRFTRVPTIIGTNRDEGRELTDRNIGWTQAQYVAWVQTNYGQGADAVLGRYPWPASTTDPLTGAYLTGAILTDWYACLTRGLTREMARYTPIYDYEFDHRTGPGLRPLPAGFVWGAGHAAELPYLWPNFDNGTPIAGKFTPAERQLATEMVLYWGSFVREGEPKLPGQPPWPRYDDDGQVLSLRAGGQTSVISDATFVAEHQCGFWDSPPPAAK